MTKIINRLEAWLIGWLPAPVRSRLIGAHAANKAIVRSAFWLVLFVLTAKLVATGKEIAVAYRFGTSATVEGYLFVFNLLSWPVSLLFSVMSAVVIPHLVAIQRTDPTHAAGWQRQVTTWVWLTAFTLGGGTALALPPLVATGWLGLEAPALASARETLPWLSGMVTLGIVAAWYACQLMSRQKHANTFLEAMPALGILVAVLVWPAAGQSAQPLLWGTLAGFLAQVVLLGWVARHAHLPIGLTWPPEQPFRRDLLGKAGWVLAGQFIMGAAGVIDQILLAHMPSGNLASYGYAYRVMSLALTLSATVIGRAFLPVLAGEPNEAVRLELTRRWARRMLWLGVMSALLLIALAQPVVALLFERGNFTVEDTERVTHLLRLMALQWPPYLAGIVWVQYALTRSDGGRELWWAALTGTLAKLSVALGLIAWANWEAEAVCIGTAICYFSTWIVLKSSGYKFSAVGKLH